MPTPVDPTIPTESGVEPSSRPAAVAALGDGALEAETERFGGLSNRRRLIVQGLLDTPGDRPDSSEVEIPVGFGELGHVGPWQVAHPSGATVIASVETGT